MPYIDPAKQKEAQARWYQRKRADPVAYERRMKEQRDRRELARARRIAEGSHRSVISKRRKTNREMIEEIIFNAKIVGCIKCGETDQSCLDFHHKDPKQKSFGISVARRKEKSWREIQAEMQKCVVVCKNCHAKHHAGRFKL